MILSSRKRKEKRLSFSSQVDGSVFREGQAVIKHRTFTSDFPLFLPPNTERPRWLPLTQDFRFSMAKLEIAN
jgi:hypothetical protein